VRPPVVDESELARRFSSHQPESWQIQAMEEIRTRCHELGQLITARVPAGREQMLALTHLENVMFTANAGIARPVPPQQGGS
jgi:predicted ABC-type ATPase